MRKMIINMTMAGLLLGSFAVPSFAQETVDRDEAVQDFSIPEFHGGTRGNGGGAFTDRAGFCALGSVKSNIGHALAAAGIAGHFVDVRSLR